MNSPKQEQSASSPADFDTWQQNPYTKVLEKSIAEDYVPRSAASPPVALPHPAAPEASAMLDAVLAEYNWPANPKNAARAGYEAARRLLALPAASSPVALTDEQIASQLIASGIVDCLNDTDSMHSVRHEAARCVAFVRALLATPNTPPPQEPK